MARGHAKVELGGDVDADQVILVDIGNTLQRDARYIVGQRSKVAVLWPALVPDADHECSLVLLASRIERLIHHVRREEAIVSLKRLVQRLKSTDRSAVAQSPRDEGRG